MTKFGVFLPVSGRAASRKTLMQAAQEAEALGYDSVWAADRLVIPWNIDTTYPYSKSRLLSCRPIGPSSIPLLVWLFSPVAPRKSSSA